MAENCSLFAFGPYVLDATQRKLSRGQDLVALTPKAFDLLALLVRHSGRVVEKEAILREVWPDTVVDEGNLTFQISTLRKAIGPDIIVTVPGRGYQLAASTQTMTQTMDAVEVVVEERTTTTITTDVRKVVLAAVLITVLVATGFLLTRSRSEGPPAPASVRSLAVLPFKPVVANQRDEALEIGMADALITRISRLKNVAVRPLTAVRRYSAIDQDAVEAGRALGVDAVLDGSILNANGRIRINARLLRVADGQQMWQGQFDNADADIFVVQESMSERLADAVTPNLSPEERRQLRRVETGNLEAYRAYTLGRLNYYSIRSDRFDKAIIEFQRAVELDPRYAKAWAALAETYAVLPISSDRPAAPAFEMARKTAAKALEIEPELADAHSVLGIVAFYHDWNWAESERHQRHAIELNPREAWYRFKYAHLLSNTGRHQEAEREILEAIRLEPLSPMINTMAGQFYLHAERYDLAERQLLHTLQIAPDFWIAHVTLGKVLERTHRLDDARRHYEAARRGSGDNVEALSMLAYLSAIEGKRDEARQRISEMLAVRKKRYFTPAKLALPYAGLGDKDEAFRWLARACQERDVGLLFINVNPRWKDAGLRNDPRWAAVENCVSLP